MFVQLRRGAERVNMADKKKDKKLEEVRDILEQEVEGNQISYSITTRKRAKFDRW